MKVGPWLLALGAVALLHTPARAEIKNWEKTFEVGPMPVVRVQTSDARVFIHPGPAGRVVAKVRREHRHWGFVSSPKDPVVTLEQVGGEVRVTVRDASWIVAIGAVQDDMSVDLTVPDSSDVRVRSSDGSVELQGPLGGRFDIATNDGRITLADCRGDLHLNTGDGSILGTGLDGVAVAESGDGRIELEGRFDVLSARARDGRMRVQARPGSVLAGPWSLETNDHSLELLIPNDLQADLDARTGDGRIRFNLPVAAPATLKNGEIVGRLNGGGPILRVRTNDGALTLDVAN